MDRRESRQVRTPKPSAYPAQAGGPCRLQVTSATSGNNGGISGGAPFANSYAYDMFDLQTGSQIGSAQTPAGGRMLLGPVIPATRGQYAMIAGQAVLQWAWETEMGAVVCPS